MVHRSRIPKRTCRWRGSEGPIWGHLQNTGVLLDTDAFAVREQAVQACVGDGSRGTLANHAREEFADAAAAVAEEADALSGEQRRLLLKQAGQAQVQGTRVDVADAGGQQQRRCNLCFETRCRAWRLLRFGCRINCVPGPILEVASANLGVGLLCHLAEGYVVGDAGQLFGGEGAGANEVLSHRSSAPSPVAS